MTINAIWLRLVFRNCVWNIGGEQLIKPSRRTWTTFSLAINIILFTRANAYTSRLHINKIVFLQKKIELIIYNNFWFNQQSIYFLKLSPCVSFIQCFRFVFPNQRVFVETSWRVTCKSNEKMKSILLKIPYWHSILELNMVAGRWAEIEARVHCLLLRSFKHQTADHLSTSQFLIQ